MGVVWAILREEVFAKKKERNEIHIFYSCKLFFLAIYVKEYRQYGIKKRRTELGSFRTDARLKRDFVVVVAVVVVVVAVRRRNHQNWVVVVVVVAFAIAAASIVEAVGTVVAEDPRSR